MTNTVTQLDLARSALRLAQDQLEVQDFLPAWEFAQLSLSHLRASGFETDESIAINEDAFDVTCSAGDWLLSMPEPSDRIKVAKEVHLSAINAIGHDWYFVRVAANFAKLLLLPVKGENELMA